MHRRADESGAGNGGVTKLEVRIKKLGIAIVLKIAAFALDE